MHRTISALCRIAASGLIASFVLMATVVVFAQQQTGVIVQDAPLLLLPEKGRSPLLVIEKGVSVQVIRREGEWFNITVQGSQWGERTGYVEARYLQLRATDPPQQPPAPVPVTRLEAPNPVASVPRPVGDVSLKNVRRIFIEPMPGDLNQYISTEITKALQGRLVVVLDKANADAIMRRVEQNTSASIALIDRNETVVIWASEAGDRSLMRDALARGGQRKAADRVVNNLKKALNEAK